MASASFGDKVDCLHQVEIKTGFCASGIVEGVERRAESLVILGYDILQSDKDQAMSTDTQTDGDLPKTSSADHSGGGAGATSSSKRPAKTLEHSDEGIRPEDLNTENDQGAA